MTRDEIRATLTYMPREQTGGGDETIDGWRVLDVERYGDPEILSHDERNNQVWVTLNDDVGHVVLSRGGRVSCEHESGARATLVVALPETPGPYVVSEATISGPHDAEIEPKMLSRRTLSRLVAHVTGSRDAPWTSAWMSGEQDEVDLESLTQTELADRHAALDLVTYVGAHMCRANPTKAIQDRRGISRAAAAQRVARLRERGLLEATDQGKAGL